MHNHIVHWMVAIITEQGGKKLVHYGHTHDISLSEATIFCDEKLDLKGPITLEVRIPEGKSINEWVVVEVKCRSAFMVAEEDHFRLQLHFESFTGDGKQVLENAFRERGASLESS